MSKIVQEQCDVCGRRYDQEPRDTRFEFKNVLVFADAAICVECARKTTVMDFMANVAVPIQRRKKH